MKIKIIISTLLLLMAVNISADSWIEMYDLTGTPQDTWIGKCKFTGDTPKEITWFGSLKVYHNGDFKKQYVEGKYDCYVGSGTIWVIFNSLQVKESFKFVGKGKVQTCPNT
ncbi:MAG: hypothetical protein FD181_542 [Prolixibacteraceae bacterium]|nr:MAG: hypothetical protein FD181_542 [Prolixibacteraceae bacterium]